MMVAAQNILRAADDSMANKNFAEFRIQIDFASELLIEVSLATARAKTSWPRNPMFGLVANRTGWLHTVQYKMQKIDTTQYPDSFEKGKAAYKEALDIYE